MGIQRLTHDLAPYAQTVRFQHSSADGTDHKSLATEDWVIDGPSLAYHAYNAALKHNDLPTSGIEICLVAYNVVNRHIVDLLSFLEEHAIHVKAIYFDGKLPAAKRAIRLDRLEKTRQQLQVFSSLYPGKKATPPPLPFLVANVIESLRVSVWSNRVFVVPEEADVACARAAATHKVSILTNDSDLAIYSLKVGSRILWLHSLDFDVAESHTSLITVSALDPNAVAARLGLISLTDFGFERKQDSSATTGAVLERAKQVSPSRSGDPEYIRFCNEYRISAYHHVNLLFDLAGLDPRTAEFAVQAATSKEPPYVYMPMLLEDPTRDASWSYGADFRRLAYSILARPANSGVPEVVEHFRKGQRVVASTMALMTSHEVSGAVTLVCEKLDHVTPAKTADEAVMSWYCLAMEMLKAEKAELGKDLSILAVYSSYGTGKDAKDAYFWDCMHIHASLHAILYSLRMLKQIIALIGTKHDATHDHVTEFDKMAGLLNGLPTIEKLFIDMQQFRLLAARLGLEGMKAASMQDQSVNRDEVVGQDLGEQERQHKSKKRKKGKIREPRNAADEPRNRFELLADVDPAGNNR